MEGHTVDRGGVHHHRQRASEGSGLEGLEILLADHLRREIGRRTVLARPWRTVGEVMLRARAYVETVDMVGIVTLITLDLGNHHLRIDDGILAETLPDTWPTGIATEIDHGVIHPRTVGRTALVGRDLSTRKGQIGIERGAEVDGLREEGAALRIGDTMVMVETVDIRDAEILHRLLLDQTDPLLPVVHLGGTGARGVEDRAHLPLGDERVEHHLVDLPDALGLALVDIHREAAELVDDLLIRKFHHRFDLLIRTAVLLEYGAHLLAVDLGVLNGHLADDVEGEFEHLSNLLVERHAGEGFLYLCLQCRVAGNGGLLGLCDCGNTGHSHHKKRFLHIEIV